MNKYAILLYEDEDPEDSTVPIFERLLVKYFDTTKITRPIIPFEAETALTGVKVIYQKENSMIKVFNDNWGWSDSEKEPHQPFTIDETDYLFEAEDDNAAKLIYEVM